MKALSIVEEFENMDMEQMVHIEKMNKRTEIKKGKKTYQNSIFEFDGHRYRGGVEQSAKLSLAITLAKDMSLTEGIIFDIDNNEVRVDEQTVKQLSIAFNAKLYGAKRKEAALFRKIDEAITINQVLLISWDS